RVPLTAAASRPAWVYKPAARAVVDRFDSSALAPVRPTIARLHTLRCPQTSDDPLLLLHRWLGSIHRRRSERPSGTPCRTGHRNESWAIPSLSRATPSAASCVSFQLRPLPSTGITRFQRYCEPLRHPKRPGLALASCQLIPTAITAGASRVASGPLCLHAVATTPAGPMEPIRS